jgi:hypothetical protein
MSIHTQGIIGEKLGLNVITKLVNPDRIMQADWLFKVNDQWCASEIKNKKAFRSNKTDFVGQGLNIKQLESRLAFQKDTGIRCLFVCFEPGSKYVHIQWLDTLNKTPDKLIFGQSGIVIFNLKHFRTLDRYSL